MLPLGLAIAIPAAPAFWHLADWSYSAYPVVTVVTPIVGVVGYLTGWVTSHFVVSLTGTAQRKAVLWGVLVVLLLPTCYAGWTRQRWFYVAVHVDARKISPTRIRFC